MYKQLLIFVVALHLSSASEKLKEEASNVQCKGQSINIEAEDMAVILECATELQVTSQDDLTPEKKACFGKCMTVKKGFIDAEGKPHKEKIMESIDGNLPDSLKEEVKVLLSKCLDDHGPKVKAVDPTCGSYMPLTECIHQAYIDMCKTK